MRQRDDIVRITEAARLIGVHPQNLREAADAGLIPSHIIRGQNQRRFRVQDLYEYAGIVTHTADSCREVAYVRVSGSSGQESSLLSQEKELRERANIEKVYKDKASGLSTKRRGLCRLLNDAQTGKFDRVLVTHEDRLARFGADWIRQLLSAYGVELVIVHEKSGMSAHEELMQDLMSLIASFSGRFYKMRSLESQKQVVNLIQKELDQRDV